MILTPHNAQMIVRSKVLIKSETTQYYKTRIEISRKHPPFYLWWTLNPFRNTHITMTNGFNDIECSLSDQACKEIY